MNNNHAIIVLYKQSIKWSWNTLNLCKIIIWNSKYCTVHNFIFECVFLLFVNCLRVVDVSFYALLWSAWQWLILYKEIHCGSKDFWNVVCILSLCNSLFLQIHFCPLGITWKMWLWAKFTFFLCGSRSNTWN